MEYVVQFDTKTIVVEAINLLDVFTKIKFSEYGHLGIVRIRKHDLTVLYGEPLPQDDRITYMGRGR